MGGGANYDLALLTKALKELAGAIDDGRERLRAAICFEHFNFGTVKKGDKLHTVNERNFSDNIY